MFYRIVTSVVATVLTGMLTAAQADESVTLRLKWFHQAQFAGFYVAKEKDFYKSAGLNLDIQPGGPDFPAVQMVAGGNEQFGVTGYPTLLVIAPDGTVQGIFIGYNLTLREELTACVRRLVMK